VEDQVLKELRVIVLLLHGCVAEKIAIMKDGLLLGFEEDITTIEDSFQNRCAWHLIFFLIIFFCIHKSPFRNFIYYFHLFS